jgi:RNase H-fold protein (predicted Holliday junction resolvase)
VAAERALVGGGVRRRDRRGVVDQVAASVFLQTWLDGRRGTGGVSRRGSGNPKGVPR